MSAGRDVNGEPLRIDWIPGAAPSREAQGRLGLTLLPGKRGASARYPGLVYARDLHRDLASLQGAGVRRLVLLVDDEELRRWGEPDIVERAAPYGIEVVRHPIADGGVPGSPQAMAQVIADVDAGLRQGNVAIACMAGIGRSGLVAACVLVARGVPPDEAIGEVRARRHPSAVESSAQEAFVRRYADAARPGGTGPGAARVRRG
jgi:protein-tyrosine phosphatase